MTCEEFLLLLDQWDALTEEEKEEARAHAVACEGCAEYVRMRDDLSHLDDDIEVPDAFASAWRRQIREENKVTEITKKRKPWRAWLTAAAAVVFVIGGTLGTRDLWPGNEKTLLEGDTASYGMLSRAAAPQASNVMMEDGAAYDSGSGAAYKMAESADDAAAQTAKIIRTASFTVKTQAFDGDYQAMLSLVTEMGGRVAYSSVSGDTSAGTLRTARLTLRIPTDRLDAFLAGAAGVGEVTNMTQSAEDVSESYYDLQSRLDTQRSKMARLKELMAKTESVSELIEVESAIADTQYMIDSYQSSLNGYDSRIDDSEVTVTIREVKGSETTKSSLGDRISEAISDSADEFVNFLQDMLIFMLAALPWLLASAVIFAVIVVLIKKKKKKGGN